MSFFGSIGNGLASTFSNIGDFIGLDGSFGFDNGQTWGSIGNGNFAKAFVGDTVDTAAKVDPKLYLGLKDIPATATATPASTVGSVGGTVVKKVVKDTGKDTGLLGFFDKHANGIKAITGLAGTGFNIYNKYNTSKMAKKYYNSLMEDKEYNRRKNEEAERALNNAFA